HSSISISSFVLMLFSSPASRNNPPLRSFPTRRSSDLSPPIQRRLRSLMYSSSTSSTDSSASGLTPVSARAWRATARIASVSTSTPDSLTISTDNPVPLACHPRSAAPAGPPAGHPDRLGLLRGVPPRVGVHDVADQLVPHDVVAGEPGEVDVVETGEDVLHDAQPAGGATGQVDLRDVPGHDDLGPEPQPGQEHLHLLGGGVLG